MSVKRHLKDYLGNLTPELSELYIKKLADFNINDPYEIPIAEFHENMEEWPEIQHGDIVNYLVFGTHSLTHQEMKSYKSLEAHNYYTSGWVNNHLFVKVLEDGRILILGEVKHSQALRAPPLKIWLLCKKDGEILTGHCNCMAGMGEACSHIGALLFFIEAGVKILKDKSCTEKRKAWLEPHTKDVQYLQIKDIDFGSASSKVCGGVRKKVKKQPNVKVSEPSEKEKYELYENLHNAGASSAILSVVEPFNNKFIPDDSIKVLINLYSSENVQLSWQELKIKCQEIIDKVIITKSDAEKIEKDTKLQYKSKKWFLYRTGRITASIMKAVNHTNIETPAKSLLKRICYPSSKNISSPATEWGILNESTAKKKYIAEMENEHNNFHLSDSGFHISPDFPFLGASPDGLTVCDCCGHGVIEVKCPFVSRNDYMSELTKGKNSFLVEDEVGNFSLDKRHEYYYQVQTHLLVTGSNHCDFVVWTEKDFFKERIYPDILFHETICEKASVFFSIAILPELLSKWYTRK